MAYMFKDKQNRLLLVVVIIATIILISIIMQGGFDAWWAFWGTAIGIAAWLFENVMEARRAILNDNDKIRLVNELRSGNDHRIVAAVREISEKRLQLQNVLHGADLSGQSLQGINLSKGELLSVDFSNTDLQRANLVRANLLTANLQNADLRRANLKGANLLRANLTGANLQGAILEKTNLKRAILPDGSEYHKDIDITVFTGNGGSRD